MMGRFLNAFARSSELYGEICADPLWPSCRMEPFAQTRNADDWQSLPPCLLDPVRDNVLRDLQGSGDIRALYACRDSHYLYVRLDCRQPVSRRLTYTLHLRPFGTNGQTTTSPRASPPAPRRAGNHLPGRYSPGLPKPQRWKPQFRWILEEGVGEEKEKGEKEKRRQKTEDRRQKVANYQLSTINYQPLLPLCDCRGERGNVGRIGNR